MAATGAVGRMAPIPWFQRMLDSIPFLVLLGVLFPTGLYTVWSVLELRDLPHFSAAPNGVLHGAGVHGATVAADAATATTAAAGADGAVVRMAGLAFVPKVLEVSVGTTVTWVNDDPYDHAVASGTPDTPPEARVFEGSGDFGPGGSFAVDFDAPGTFDVYCSTPGHFASGMTMTVVVTEEVR
jgi:plastocyanin